MDSINLEKKLKNTAKVRKLLFGRKTLQSHSFFEKFWGIKLAMEVSDDVSDEYYEWISDQTLHHYKCADYIWNEFRLWEKPEILAMASFLIFFQTFLFTKFLIAI